MEGVVTTHVGYAGGTKKDPSYYSLGDYTETIRIDFDPAKVSYEQQIGRASCRERVSSPV